MGVSVTCGVLAGTSMAAATVGASVGTLFAAQDELRMDNKTTITNGIQVCDLIINRS
jgi:hypothetical protein